MSKKEKRPSILNREMADMHEDGVRFNEKVLKKKRALRDPRNNPNKRDGGLTSVEKLNS